MCFHVVQGALHVLVDAVDQERRGEGDRKGGFETGYRLDALLASHVKAAADILAEEGGGRSSTEIR